MKGYEEKSVKEIKKYHQQMVGMMKGRNGKSAAKVFAEEKRAKGRIIEKEKCKRKPQQRKERPSRCGQWMNDVKEQKNRGKGKPDASWRECKIGLSRRKRIAVRKVEKPGNSSGGLSVRLPQKSPAWSWGQQE